jgi:hypothetical protein
MKVNLTLIAIFALFLAGSYRATAQCSYTLSMSDSFGDGWNAGVLTITNGASSTDYTLDGINDNGDENTVTFVVNAGQPLTLIWTSGFFDEEVSFNLFDANGLLVFSAADPTAGNLYTGIAACPTCIVPTNFKIENIYDTRVRLRWTPSGANAVAWRVIYGPQGFIPGPGVGDTVTVGLPKVQITGLQKKTAYSAYLQQDCGNGDFSVLIGPLDFTTYWTNDVGISGVTAPLSGCDLGVETVKILMSNYGAAPQSLVPFRYSVNGEDAGVSQPNDGFYTGVLGKDSTELIEFETTYDFSAPGEYLITVYTQMTGDEDPSNDSFNIYIVNRLVPPYSQTFESWEGGWYVDTTLSENSSWAYGHPDAIDINGAASGERAWVTNLTGPYNLQEVSYLNSPCFDFSGVTGTPVIEFALNTAMDQTFDGGYLEMSTDDGATWDKVGAVGEGLNWYNTTNFFNALGDVWSGNTENIWVTARHSLPGAAGESSVRLRFVFNGGIFFIAGEGMGVDNIAIYVPVPKDLAGVSASSLGDANPCGLVDDQVTFTFTNFGSQNQSFFQVAYSINGGAPVLENVGAVVLSPDEVFTYTFNNTFDSRDGSFTIRCWPLLNGEQVPANDTVVYQVSHLAKPLPIQTNFESIALPDGWQSLGGGFITNTHNNTSYVHAINMYSGATSFELISARHGLVSDGDSLSFDYRITNWSAGTVATTLIDSEINVEVTTDCGDSWVTVYSINSTTHTPAVGMVKRFVNLSQFAGKSIQVRFIGSWAEGDFWFDVDNINILACAADMQLNAVVNNPTPGINNGSAGVTVGTGNPPYKYKWSTGSTLPAIANLAAGQYTVTVTDALGCSNVLVVFVGITGTQDIDGLTRLSLQPNPTSDATQLIAAFDRSVDVHVEVINLVGQRIWETHASRTNQLDETLDLNAYPAGLYLMRLTVDGQVLSRKIVKQ